MELVYGTGYLSAGGDQEVGKILQGISLEGKRILDLGCGLGGATVTLARDLGATDVVGFDIDPGVLGRAAELIQLNDLDGQIELVPGSPGPLPFSDHSFDLVYVTAVSCHMQDLVGFFRDINRILVSEGWITGSEWMIRQHNQGYRNWDKLLRDRGLNFYFVDPADFAAALTGSGFDNLGFVDRTDAFTEFSRTALERVTTRLKPELISSLGEQGYAGFLEWTVARFAGLQSGGLFQQHFRGQKI